MLPLGKHNVGKDFFLPLIGFFFFFLLNPLFGYEYNVKHVMFYKTFLALKNENIFPSTGFVFRQPLKMFSVHLRFHHTKYQNF
jgi:hypothetical protein